MKKVTVHFKSSGPSGNIYAIMCLVSDALRKQHRPTDYNTMRDRILNESHSYVQSLEIVREYVNLIDEDGRF